MWVSAFADVAWWQGFVYLAFVIEAFAPRIIGWRPTAAMARSWTCINRPGSSGGFGVSGAGT
ncbi:hypothetical protein AcidC75_32780 [Acidisoma sp. C75]